MNRKRFLLFIILLSGLALLPCMASADPFTVSLPAGSAITMGDSTAELPFLISNGGAGDIRDIIFTINPALYNFSAATVPPPGWCIKSIAAGTIEFALVQGGGACSSGASAAQIGAGQSRTFTITLTGPGGGAIPAAASDAATDTLTSAAVSVQGGFVLSGGLPAWTRKALAASLTASPLSVGIGDTIALTVSVTNRSTAGQSGIVASPDPPSPVYTGGASVSLVGNAVYSSTASTANPAPVALTGNINASTSTISVSSTSGYPSSGRLLIGNELIDYTGATAVSFTGATRGRGGTAASAHAGGSLLFSQNTSSFNLAPGETGTILWHYKADANGAVTFNAASRNATGTATSKSESSDAVIIGPFTAAVSVSPLSVVSGQVAAVTMTVANNGTSTLTNVTPSITPGGTAVKNLSTGPAPAGIASLAPGETGTFTWTYVITGSPTQTYLFSASAASGAQTTNNAASETGEITQYAVAGTPLVFATGSSGTITWTVSNQGGATIREVTIGIPAPLTGNCGTPGWDYAGSAASSPADWIISTTGNPESSVTFRADTPVDAHGIPIGGSRSFSVTFNCVPLVASDTEYTFPVLITDKNGNQATINTIITVTAFSLTLTAFDQDCAAAAPASKPADGNSRYCLKAVLLSGGTPAPGKTVNFTITAGSGFLSAGSMVTDGAGAARVFLTSPCSTVNTAATVTAAFPPSTTAAATVNFTGVGGSNLSYVNNSLTFDRTSPAPAVITPPVSINTGDQGAFSLQVRNCGTIGLTIQAANTTLSVRRNSADIFALNGPNVPVNAGASAVLTFNFGTIASGDLECFPILTANVNPPAGYAGMYSFNLVPPGNAIPVDTVKIGTGTTCPPPGVRILDWREAVN